MKKFLTISIIISLFIILCGPIIPVATAETTHPDINIGGITLSNNTYLKSGATTVTSTKPSDNYAYYNDGVLTLCNFSYVGAGSYINLMTGSTGIYSQGDLVITLVGTNSITLTENGYSLSTAIYTKGNLTISGDGTCNATALNYGILSEKSLTIENGSINAVAETGICAINNITVNGGAIDSTSTIDAQNNDSYIAILYYGNFTVYSGAIIEASTSPNGILGAYNTSNHTTYKRIKITAPVPTTYTIHFDANGGSSSMADVTTDDTKYTLPENSFTAPTGKQFKCWSVNGVEMQVGAQIDLTFDVTIKAVWENIPTPQIWVGGVGMLDGTYLVNNSCYTTTAQPSDYGYAYYKDGILYLNEYVYNGTNILGGPTLSAIYSTTDLTIVLVGNSSNTLNITSTNNFNGIESTGNISISGNGHLNINVTGTAIKTDGNLTINVQGNVSIVTSTNTPAINCNVSVTANEFIVIGAPNENLIRFGNPSNNIYAIYKGDSTSNLSHVDFIYDNSSYSTDIDANVIKIMVTDHTLIGENYDNEYHWDECSCGAKINKVLHNGGSSTCEHKAVCSDCGQEYGDLADHDYDELIPAAEENHTATELKPNVDAHYICGECGKYFTASKIETTLDELTGITPTHYFGDWLYNNQKHWKECSCGLKSSEANHNGGTATCEHKATCADCGQEYGDLADHNYGELIPAVTEKHTATELKPSVDAHYICGECNKYFTKDEAETTLDELTGTMPTHNFGDWLYDDQKHWKECSCGLKSSGANHNGGASTCAHKAVCSDCDQEYGDLADHDYGELIPAVAEKHTAAELKPSVDAHYICGECGKYFTKDKQETTLDELTGITPTHNFIGWFYNDEQHWKECSCGLISSEANHNGGTATCEHKAVCSDCGQEYGSLADHNYGELIPAVAEKHTATELKPSVDAHYICDECSKYFTKDKQETTLDELTGTMPTHNFGDWLYDNHKHWKECECGLESNIGEHIDINNGNPDGICDDCDYKMNIEEPDLGDDNFICFSLIIISIIGIAIISIHSKRKSVKNR